MLHIVVILTIIIITYMFDSNSDKQEQKRRENILCQIDAQRMKQIEDLKREIARIKETI